MASKLSNRDQAVVDAFKLVLELAEGNALEYDPDMEGEYLRQQEAFEIVRDVIEMNEQAEPAVIMAGSLSEGYRVIGPFVDWDAAAEYADSGFSMNVPTWIMTCEYPEETPESSNE